MLSFSGVCERFKRENESKNKINQSKWQAKVAFKVFLSGKSRSASLILERYLAMKHHVPNQHLLPLREWILREIL